MLGGCLVTKTDEKKLVAYWATLSDYDWDVMTTLYKNKSYAQALFFLHLSLEKLIKSQVVKATGVHAPFSHDLPYLLGKTGVTAPEQVVEQLRTITGFNMESRYPDENLLFYKKADQTYTKEWVGKGKGLKLWLKNQFGRK
jgi:HEPN domain-containing protein